MKRALIGALFGFGVAVAFACSTEDAAKDAAKGSTPATGNIAVLTWDASTDATLTAFHVYAVKSKATDPAAAAKDAAAVAPEAWVIVDEHDVKAAGFDAKVPSVSLDPAKLTALKPFVGGMTCFRVAAFSAAGESAPSNVQCGAL